MNNLRAFVDGVLEALSRPGLRGVRGMAIEARCTRDVKAYFVSLGTRIKQLNLEELVDGHTAEFTAIHAVEMKLHYVLRVVRPMLLQTLAVNHMEAYIAGWEDTKVSVVHEAKKKVDGAELDRLGPTGQAAADWAAKSAAESVVGIDKTTMQTMQDLIKQGVEERLGVPGTARLIRNAVEDMTTQRAQLIATTEMNSAFSQAALDKMEATGTMYKQWITHGDPCDYCGENEDQGAIPLMDSFSSGDSRPPAHPRCRCAVAPARPPKE